MSLSKNELLKIKNEMAELQLREIENERPFFELSEYPGCWLELSNVQHFLKNPELYESEWPGCTSGIA